MSNPSIRSFWPALSAPGEGGLTTAGRPLVHMSLALNHALSGEHVWSYHLLNLLIHLGAGLLLFGIVARTLMLPRWQGRFAGTAPALAWSIAALWMLHPLQTESVTYIVQRAESLMGFFYFLTLYGFVRSLDSPHATRWRVLAWSACLLGMASKEVMVSAPLMLFFYDRTFVAGSFAAAWRQRARFHVALAGTWLLLGLLLWTTKNRGGTAGFGEYMSVADYALTQCSAIIHYLRLTFWPHPLVFDYGFGISRTIIEVWPQALGLVVLAVVTVWALVRRPVLGFFGLWFFALLAPSSSVIPVVTQTIAEHRMYLALAAPLILLVAGVQAWLGGLRATGLLLPLIAACGVTTYVRNRDYLSDVGLWRDTIAKCPGNPRAHYNLATIIGHSGHWEDAVEGCRRAIELNPTYVDAYNNLGLALVQLGNATEAEQAWTEAIRLKPEHPEARNNLAKLLADHGRFDEAVEHLRAAIRARPGFAEAHNNLGDTLRQQGKLAEAQSEFEIALRLNPELVETQNNLGNILQMQGRIEDAIARYREALRLDPQYAAAHFNWGNACLQTGQLDGAIAHYEAAVRLKSNYPTAEFNWGNALAQKGQVAEAALHFQRAVTLKPDYADALVNLANVQLSLKRLPEALANFERAIAISPRLPIARRNYGIALAQLGRVAEALAQYEELLKLVPSDPGVREEYEQLRRWAH